MILLKDIPDLYNLEDQTSELPNHFMDEGENGLAVWTFDINPTKYLKSSSKKKNGTTTNNYCVLVQVHPNTEELFMWRVLEIPSGETFLIDANKTTLDKLDDAIDAIANKREPYLDGEL